MILVILTILAISEATLEKRYIGLGGGGFGGFLGSPFGSRSSTVPSGGYTNDDLGVVVDAAAPGTRISGAEPTGLGGPRTSYGSLDSKVGDAAFRTGDTAVKGVATEIASLFGSGTDQVGNIGFGLQPGSSSLGGSGIKTPGAEVPGFGLTKTTYKSVDSNGGDAALNVGNRGAAGISSALGSGIEQGANIGLPSFGTTSGSSSLGEFGIKTPSAEVPGFGLTKTTYKTIDSNGGDAALNVGNRGAAGISSVLGSGIDQGANIGLPSFGTTSGSSSLGGSGIKTPSAEVPGYGLTKTTYKTIDSNGGDAALNVGNRGAAGISSALGSGIEQGANIGLPSFGTTSGSSSLGGSGIKTPSAEVPGYGLTKTTYKTIDSNGGDAALNVGNRGAAGISSVLGSGIEQGANIGLPSFGTMSGSSSLGGFGIKTTGAELPGLGDLKIAHDSIDSKVGGTLLGLGNAATKGDATGFGSLFGSSTGQKANIGLPGIDIAPGSSSLDVAGIKTTGAGLSNLGISKAETAFGVGNAAVKGTAGHVDESPFSVQKYNDKSDFSSSNGDENTKLSISSEDAALKINNPSLSSLNAGSVTVQDLTGDFQTDSSHGIIQDSVFHKTQEFGVHEQKNGASVILSDRSPISKITTSYSTGLPNLGLQLTGSSNGNFAYSAEIPTEFGTVNSLYTGSLNLGGQKTHDYKFGSYCLTNPSYPGYKVVDNRPKLPSYQETNLPTKTYLSHKSNTPTALTQSGQYHGFISSHNSGITDASISPFSLSLPKISKNVGQLSVSQDPFVLNGNQHTFAVKPISHADQKPIIESQSNQEFNVNENASQINYKHGTVYEYNKLTSYKENQANSDKLDKILFPLQGKKINQQEKQRFDSFSSLNQTHQNSIGSLKISSNLPQSQLDGQNSPLDASKYSKLGSSSQQTLGTLFNQNEGSKSMTLSHNTDSSLQSQSGSTFGSQFEKKPLTTRILSKSSPIFENKFVETASIGSGYENIQLGSLPTLLTNENSKPIQSISLSQKGSAEEPLQVYELSVKPFGFSPSTGSNYSQTWFGSMFGTQISQDLHKSIGTTSVVTSQVQSISQIRDTPVGLQSSPHSSQQSQYNSTTGSKYIQKAVSTGAVSQTFTELKQKPNYNSQRGSGTEKTQYVYPSNSLQKENAEYSQSDSSLNNDRYKSHTVQIPQFGVNPFGFVQNTGSSFSKTSVDSTFGTKTGQNSIKGAGQTSVVTSHNQPISQYGIKLIRPQSSQYSSQYSSTTGSKFGQEQESTGTLSQTYTAFRQKPTYTSQKDSETGKTQFAFSSSSLQTENCQSSQSNSSYNSGESKGHPVQISEFEVKPFGSLQNIGSSFSQPSVGSTFGSQSSQNSHKGAGTTSVVTSHVQPISEYDIKTISSQFSQYSPQQSQHSSTTGSKFGQKHESAGTLSQTYTVLQQKPTDTSQKGSETGKTQFAFSSTSFKNENSQSSQSDSSSNSGVPKGHSVHISQFGVPFGSVQNTESSLSQSSVGSRFEIQNGQNSHKGSEAISVFTSQVQPISEYGKKTISSQSSQYSAQQSQYSSTNGSKFGQKPESTGTLSQTYTVLRQKPTNTSQKGPETEKTQFVFSSTSLNRENSQSSQTDSSSNSGEFKGHFVQLSQLGVKPFGSVQNRHTESSSQNSHKGAGATAVVTSQVQPISEYDKKAISTQFSQYSPQQSQYSSTNGSKFGQRPESTGTLSQTDTVLRQKPTNASRKGSETENNQFVFSSTSLNKENSQSSQSDSSSNNGEPKGNSVQISQFGVKTFGSVQNTESSLSQSLVGRTFGNQSVQNLHKGTRTTSVVKAQIQPISEYGKKPMTSQFSQYSYQQSQHSSTTGSKFGQKPQAAGTLSKTYTVLQQKPTDTSQKGSETGKTQFAFSSTSFKNENSQSSQSDSSSNSGEPKGHSVHISQFGEPFGSVQNTESSLSQSSVGSRFEIQNGHNSHKGSEAVSVFTSQVQPISEYGKKTISSQSSQYSAQQSQHSSTNGSMFGQKSESTGTLSQTYAVLRQKPTNTSQKGSETEKTQFVFSSTSLNRENSQSSQTDSSTNSGEFKGHFVQLSQLGVKPFGSVQNRHTESSNQNSHKGAGATAVVTSQVQPISEYDKKIISSQFSQYSPQKSQYSSTNGSKFGQRPESTGTLSQTDTVLRQKTTNASRKDFETENNQFVFSSTSLNKENSQSSQSDSSSNNSEPKGNSVHISQFGEPFGSVQNTESSLSQSPVGSRFGIQNGQNSHKGSGAISVFRSQVQPISEYGKKTITSQSSQYSAQQSQYSSTNRSKFGQKPESTGTLSQTYTVLRQKPTDTSLTGPETEKTQFVFSSTSLKKENSQSSQTNSSSNSGKSKGHSVHIYQSKVSPFDSIQNTGSSFSQSLVGSTFGNQSVQNLHKGLRTTSIVKPQIQPISEYGNKSMTSQFSQYSAQQSQYSSTNGSKFGKKPESTGTLSKTYTVFRQKPTDTSQKGSEIEKTQFVFSSSSLNKENSQTSQTNSSSNSGEFKGQSEQLPQVGVKPFGSVQNTESSSQNSHKGAGVISVVTSHIQPISEYDKKTVSSQFSQYSSQQLQHSSTGSKFDQKPKSAGTLSQTYTVLGQTPTDTSQKGSETGKTQFAFSSSFLQNKNSQSSQSDSSSKSGEVKGHSVQISEFEVKPFDSFQNIGSSFSQSSVGSTFGNQSSQNSHKGTGTNFVVKLHVRPVSQSSIKPISSQSSQYSSQQSQYISSTGSTFGQKTGSTETLSQTYTVLGQRPTNTSQKGPETGKTQLSVFSNSLKKENSQYSQSDSSSNSGEPKGQSVQIPRFGDKPFGSFQNTESSFSQSLVGSTFGNKSGQNSHEAAGITSIVIPQVQLISEYSTKTIGTQINQYSSRKSQYNSRTESKFGQKPESTETLSQTYSVLQHKPTDTSGMGSETEKTQFEFSSTSLKKENSQSSQSDSSSNSDESKGHSVQLSQFGVKSVGSVQNTGSRFSQSSVGNTFGNQSSQNSHKVAGTTFVVTSHVRPISPYRIKQISPQSSQYFTQKSQYRSTTGPKFGQKPESTGTLSQTYTVLRQKQTDTSQKDSEIGKTQFAFSSPSVKKENSQSSQTDSSSNSGAPKGYSLQISQVGVKPFGFVQNTGASFSQSSVGSSFKTQSGQNSHKGAGATSGVTSLVQPISEYGKKIISSQSSQYSAQQLQYNSTTGSKFGQKPESAETPSLAYTVLRQKSTDSSQKGSETGKTQFAFSSSSLQNKNSQSSQRDFSSDSDKSKGYSVHISELEVKPFGSVKNTGSSFSQSLAGSTFGNKSGQNSHEDAGITSIVIPQLQPISEYDKKTIGTQSNQYSSRKSQYNSRTESKFGQKPESTETLSQTYSVLQHKPTDTSRMGSETGKTQYAFFSTSLKKENSQSSQTDSSSKSGEPKGHFEQLSQFGVKHFGSVQNTDSSFSQSSVGSMFGNRSSQNSHKGTGTNFAVKLHVRPVSQSSIKPNNTQSSQYSSQQSQYISTTGSTFGQKTGSTETLSQTYTVLGQRPTNTSQKGPETGKTHLSVFSNSLKKENSQYPQSDSSSNSGEPKGQSVQIPRFGVKPFGSFQNTESSFSQSLVGSTFGNKSGQNSHEGAGITSIVIPQVQPISEYSTKTIGTQINQYSSRKSQYNSRTESKFGQKPESMETLSQTYSVLQHKPTDTSRMGSETEKTQFAFSSTSLKKENSQSSQSDSSSNSGESKGHSVQLSQFGVKSVGSVQNTGSRFSQSSVGNTFGNQSSQNSHKGAGTTFVVTSHVRPISPYSIKQISPHSSQYFTQQSQYSSTTGPKFGQKPESTGTLSQTYTVLRQKPTDTSQKGSENGKTQFAFSSTSVKKENSQSSQTDSSSNSGEPKGQSVQISQVGVKPFGSVQNTGSSSSRSSVGSSFKIQNGQTSHIGAGAASGVTSHVQPISEYSKKTISSQSGQYSAQQLQYSSTTGSKFGQKPESAGTPSLAFTVLRQKSTDSSQKSSETGKTQFAFSSSSLQNKNSQSSQRDPSSYSDKSKGHSVHISEFEVKPFGSVQNTGSSFSQSSVGSKFENQRSQNSHKGAGTNFVVKLHVRPISEYSNKPISPQSSQYSSQQSQYSAITGSKFGQKPEYTGTISQTYTVLQQKPTDTSQKGSEIGKTQFAFSSTSLKMENAHSSQTDSSSNIDEPKGHSVQISQFGVKPFRFIQNTGSSLSQSSVGSRFEIKNSQNSHKGAGATSVVTSHVQPISEYDKKTISSQSSQYSSRQAQYSATTGSKFGQKPESTGTLSQAYTILRQAPTITSRKGSETEKTQFAFASSLSKKENFESSRSDSSFNSDGPKGQSVPSSLLVVKPFRFVQNIGPRVSQSWFGQNSHKGVGTISPDTSQFSSQYVRKPFDSQSSQYSLKQSQYTSATGSKFDQKPEVIGTLSQTSTVFGQKPTSTLQTVYRDEKTQLDPLFSLLHTDKLQPTQNYSFSYSKAAEVQVGQTAPFDFKKTILNITGSDLPLSFQIQYNKNPFNIQSTQASHRENQVGATKPIWFSGSQGLSQTHQPSNYSQITDSGFQAPNLTFSLSDLSNQKSQSPFSTQSLGTAFSQSKNRIDYNTRTPFQTLFDLTTGRNQKSSLSVSSSSGVLSGIQTSQVSNYQTRQFGESSHRPFGGFLTQTVQKQTKIYGDPPSPHYLPGAH